ncbi:hypothetical protein PVAG01_06649 [Phlyctema vagabunda]|uniref:Uncharacterized protein n=1 Tax=Phlyctema vagabunda TaxID=108571 RepID=A0ABR4PGP6_9HELO
MAALPSSNANLAIHLCDRALTPLISSSSQSEGPSPSSKQSQHSSSSPSQAEALATLSSTAIAAYDTASRLQLGLPQRIMISTGPPSSSGPVILHSYLNPAVTPRQRAAAARGIVQSARDELRPLTATTVDSDPDEPEEEGTLVNGVGGREDDAKDIDDDDGEEDPSVAPLLIASVVAPKTEDTTDARRAAAKLEKMGKEFQRVWTMEQEEGRKIGGAAGDDA